MTITELKSGILTALERNKLLRRAEVQALTNMGKTKMAALMAAGLFPQPVRVIDGHGLPGGTNFWLLGEILDFVQVQIDARNKHLAEIANGGINHWVTNFPVSNKNVGGASHD